MKIRRDIRTISTLSGREEIALYIYHLHDMIIKIKSKLTNLSPYHQSANKHYWALLPLDVMLALAYIFFIRHNRRRPLGRHLYIVARERA